MGDIESNLPKDAADARARLFTEEDGRWLLERFIARHPAADTELVLQLNRLLYRVFQQHWQGKKLSFLEVRGDCFELLGRWREEGTLTIEPLPWLAQRLMKQAARQQVRGGVKDQRLVSLDAAFDAEDDAKAFGREIEAAAAQQSPWPSPEAALLGKELYQWLLAARERLSPLEQETFDASVRVADGEAPSLHEALGIEDAAARQRRRRMRVSIVELAEKDGMDQVITRWKAGRSRRRDRKVDE